MLNKFMLLVIVCAFMSCKKEQPAVSAPIESIAELLWSKEVKQRGDLILYRNQVGFVETLPNLNYLVFLDTSDGNELWRTGGVFPDLRLHLTFQNVTHVFGDRLCFLSDDGMISASVNLLERKEEWYDRRTTAGANFWFNLIDNQFYRTHGFFGSASLVRTHISAPNWDPIYTVVDSTYFPSDFSTPGLFVNDNQDSIIIFVESALKLNNIGTADYRYTLTGVHVSSKEVVFRNIGFDSGDRVDLRLMQVANNKVYVLGLSTIWCFDANDGQVIWSTKRNQSFGLVGLNEAVIHKDRIIVNSSIGQIKAFDLNTGNVIWTNEEMSGFRNLRVYKDKYLISYGANLSIHRLDDGARLFDGYELFGSFGGFDYLVIDDDSGRFYWSTDDKLRCFKLKLP